MSNVDVNPAFDISVKAYSTSTLEIRNSILDIYGTGSYPCPPQGWQRLNRLTVSHNPLNTPCFFNASMAYWEQVGVNRHLGPSKGDMTH